MAPGLPGGMTKAVFLHKPDSKYDDNLSSAYDFPRMYLATVRRTVGDWIIYYEPRSADGGTGRLAYFATARVLGVIENTAHEGRYIAVVDPSSFLTFDRAVPRVVDGLPMESDFLSPDGRITKGGKTQSAVRIISDSDFDAITSLGILARPDPWNAERANEGGMGEAPAPFERPMVQQLASRTFRDRAFRQTVLKAYEYTCAISGLTLRNGGGNPEVDAAHIRPVADNGPDDVRNGLALSKTLHWMFDRGLISVAEDSETLLISENKVPGDVVRRLIKPDRRISLPRARRDRPHPDFLAFHRENVFGRGAPITAGRESPTW